MAADKAVWTRVPGVQGGPLDLMTAWMGRRHYAPHAHAEFSIRACTAGVEVTRYRDERHLSGPGTLVVIEPGETHTGGPAGPDGMGYRVLYPLDSLLAGRPHFPAPIIEDPQLAAELCRAHRVLSQGDDVLEGESRLLCLLDLLVQRHARLSAPGVAVPRDVQPVARAVMTRLADQLTAPPGLADLAAELGMSRYQLLRAFREAVGMPPYAWLAQYRVHRARGLLEAGHRPAEAAALTGFADQAHLTRWFRRVLGVTPGEFRNSVQDGGRRQG
jgi:AraC-like DNA-binding protein